MSEEEEKPSIKVKDSRRFSADGEPVDNPDASETQKDAATEPAVEAATEPAEPTEAATDFSASSQAPPIPTASFELLIMSLGMQVQMELAGPEADDAPAPNLDMARHTIDLLVVLQEKTKGNLTMDESRQLDNMVTELRFRYVQRVNEINAKAKG
jgi:hypothetical protein